MSFRALDEVKLSSRFVCEKDEISIYLNRFQYIDFSETDFLICIDLYFFVSHRESVPLLRVLIGSVDQW